jgi:hypothetical protein
MDEETRRAVRELRAQVDYLSKVVTHLAGAEDRIKDAMAHLLTDVRQDTYRSVMSVYGELKRVDDDRVYGQRHAKIIRYLILAGMVAVIGILLYLVHLATRGGL